MVERTVRISVEGTPRHVISVQIKETFQNVDKVAFLLSGNIRIFTFL
jgi:hypothetical protein